MQQRGLGKGGMGEAQDAKLRGGVRVGVRGGGTKLRGWGVGGTPRMPSCEVGCRVGRGARVPRCLTCLSDPLPFPPPVLCCGR